MFNKFELLGGAVCICLMAAAIYLVQLRDFGLSAQQPATAIESSGLQVVSEARQLNSTVTSTEETSNENKLMKINDIKVGVGQAAASGDMVAVHYVGRLQDGTEFDNSHKRGAPIEFTIGAGQVIKGWEEGIAGMQVGGERTLVIPPEKAYGDAGIGPIPGGATLVFTVELVEIK